MKQQSFSGLQRGVDQSDLRDGKCFDCSNVDLSTFGHLSVVMGIEKINTLELDGAVVAVHQLNEEIYAVAGTEIWRL